MRKASLDVCRVLACMMVVLGHTGMLFWDFDPAAPAWAAYNLLCVFLRSSVLLFFMVSGVLFLGREKLDFKKHLKRAGHMLVLYYVWSLILNGIDALFLHYHTPGEDFLSLVLRGYFHLWFLPTMAMCYCALPLLHGMLHNNHDNVRRGAILLAAIVCVQATLNALPDKPEWLAALIAPYDFRYYRYFVMMPLGYVLYRETLSRKQLGLLGEGARKYYPLLLSVGNGVEIAVSKFLSVDHCKGFVHLFLILVGEDAQATCVRIAACGHYVMAGQKFGL